MNKIKEIIKGKESKTKISKESKMVSRLTIFIAVIITLMISITGFIAIYEFVLKDDNEVVSKLQKEVTVTDLGIADAVEKIYDAVVVVETYKSGKLYSTGTGFVFKTDDKNAYILTNYHVINNGDEIKVVFTNNNKEVVKVVGGDEYADVAVLSIDKDSIISIAETGASETLRVGDTTFAVGAPIDASTYSWTVTRGILSGKNRVVEISAINGRGTTVMKVLQTDTAINSGNSGGPLCNSNGQVIGITNLKLASNTIEGMAFAIPIETALEYADKFINGESVKRPYIGVSIYNNATIYGQVSGIYIDSIEKNSPADKSNLKAGDKITKVNDVEVSDVSFFKYELYKYNIGDTIKITYERDGKEKSTNVELGSTSEGA